MHTIKIIGAGQLGSRHLQALKKVQFPLSIEVIDPSANALKVAEERYVAFPSGPCEHQVSYHTQFEGDRSCDLAIVATSSDKRREALEKLFAHTTVKYLLLEKLLFDRPNDYSWAKDVFHQRGIQAWVNCSMRVMPFYHSLAQFFKGQALQYRVTGGQFGLITNAIHYLDHMAYLTGCTDFGLDTSNLSKPAIASKRTGFLEFNGTLLAHFANGSFGIMTCYADTAAPVLVEIMSEEARCIVRESEGLAWVATASNDWYWETVEARVPFQSEMTTKVVEEILQTGACALVSYDEATPTHLTLLESVAALLTKEQTAHTPFPFT